MEGQGKRLLLAVALALVVMLLWQMFFPGDKPEPATQGSGSGTGAVTMPQKLVARSGVCTLAPAPGAAAEAPPIKDERTVRAFAGKFDATFSTYNGSLVSWRLADARYAKDATKGELLPNKPDQGAFQVGFWKGSKQCLPEATEWVLERAKLTDTQVVYSWPAKGSAYESLGVHLEKTFTIIPDSFIVRMVVKETFKVKEPTNQQLTVSTFAFQDPKAITSGSMQVQPRIWSSSTLRDGETLLTPLKEMRADADAAPSPRREVNITWTGFEHPYLLAAYAPRRAGTESIDKHTYPLEPYGLMRTDITFDRDEKFDDKAPEVSHEVVAYLGPKNYTLLDKADSVAGFPTGFRSAIDLGWFAFIGRPLMWLLLKFQSVVVNWGIAIMLLTLLVKAVTIYWTTKSMRSMKAMAALAPQMKALQEKYKDDKQRIQAETMALYKQHNVNPIAGCLPILLQMPIWLALYRMLSNAGELYQQPFISGWIDDLTDTDPYHILPIILVVTMFVQARLTPQSTDSRQQKFLQYGMPLMFGVMSFFFPAGLTLYIFTNTCLSALHSIYMNKYDKKSLEIMARMKKNAEEAAAAKDGKKPDAKTEKKPVAKKPVIDVEAVESNTDDADSADDAAVASPSTSASPGRQRPRRKKRRR